MYDSQLDAMIKALASGRMTPPFDVAKQFKQKRINSLNRALGCTNVFASASGNFPLTDSNATFTTYTKPLQRDVIVMGCSLMAADERQDNRITGEFRVRLPNPLEHLSQNYIFPALGFAPATYSVLFPAPFILKASEQIQVDFGWNAPQAGEPLTTGRVEIVFFCASVKDCFDQDDADLFDRAARYVNETDYQRRVLLNSATQGSIAVTSQTDSPFLGGISNMVVYTPPGISSVAVTKGTLTSSETRQADVPLLVVGFSTAACGESIRITDTGTGYSFTQGDFIYSHSLFYPEEFIHSLYRGPYYSYFRLPVPHLLRPGATLFTEHLATPEAEQDPFNPEYLVWECITP
jgi:hypothetical protein